MKNTFLYTLLDMISYRYGVISYFKNDKLIGKALHEYGEWAQKEIDFLLRLIQPGDTVFDIGAFIGTHTLAFAQKAGADGRIYSIEPNPVSFEVLELNVEQNQLSNVVCENVALSNSETILNFNFSNWVDANPGSTSLVENGEDPGTTPAHLATIFTKRLDQYTVQACRLIKVDVEGMEIDVLEGGKNFLRTHRPFVYAECLSVENGAKIISFMEKENYLSFIHSVEAYSSENYFKNENNVLFGPAREVSIAFIPFEKKMEFQNLLEDPHIIIPYQTLDDLVVAMLNKPQYKYEVLEKTNAANFQDIDYILSGSEGGTNDQMLNLVDRSNKLAVQIEEKDKNIQEFISQIEEKDKNIQEFISQIEEKDKNIQEFISQIEEKDKNIQEFISQIEHKTSQILELTAQLEEKAFSIERLENENSAAIRELTLKYNDELQRKNKALQTLLTRLASKEKAIEALEPQLIIQTNEARIFSQQLWEIQHSRAWKLVQKIWELRLRFLPHGSLRIRILRAVYHGSKILFTQGIPPFFRYVREKRIALPKRATAVPSYTSNESTTKQPVDYLKHPNPVYHSSYLNEPQLPPLTTSLPDEGVSHNMLLARVKDNLKHRDFMISISHDDYLTTLGGSQIFMSDEQKLMEKRDVSYIHLYPISQYDNLNDEPALTVGLNVDSHFIGQYSVKDIAKLLAESLDGEHTCLSVNLHHFKGWTINGLKTILSSARSKRFIYYVHDFFAVCPQYTLLRNNSVFCNAPALESHACNICVFGEKRKIHLPLSKEIFANFPFMIVAPSKSTSDLWLMTFPEFTGKIRIEPHLIEKDSEIPISYQTNETIRVAYSGGPAKNKGWELWREVVGRFFSNANYKFIHLGIRYGEYPEAYENVRVSRTNRKAMLDALLNCRIDVLFHCPIWPETFSYVLYEAIGAGCFILTLSQSGNVADYVRKHKNGIVFETFEDLHKYIAEPENLWNDLDRFHKLYPRQKIIEMNETIPCLIKEAPLEG